DQGHLGRAQDPADPHEPVVERREVHRDRCDPARRTRAERRGRDRSRGQRNRNCTGASRADLRSVLAGRAVVDASVRRHGPRTGCIAQAGEAARGPAGSAEQGRRRQRVPADPAGAHAGHAEAELTERDGLDVPDRLRSRRDGRGRFVHPWPLEDDTSRVLRDILRWQAERRENGVAPNPPPGAFPLARPEVALPRNDGDELRLTWAGHATVLIQLEGSNILTDPVWSRRVSPLRWVGPARLVPPGLPFDELPQIDAVLLSHDHYAPLDTDTAPRLHARFGDALQWVTPLGYSSWLAGRGVRNVTELDWWSTARVDTPGGELRVRATPAQHWTKRTPFSERTRLWSSFVIEGRQ